MNCWQFWVDVGGTFTDCLAKSPEGSLVELKVLSSAIEKGTISSIARDNFVASGNHGTNDFWIGYECKFFDATGEIVEVCRISGFDSSKTLFEFEKLVCTETTQRARSFSITANEPAPIFAIRKTLNLRLSDSIPPLLLDLGTTRGTNALLTRSGAKTAFVTTAGFKDILEIGDQARPDIFALDIAKNSPLYFCSVEIPERIAHDGSVLLPLDLKVTRKLLVQLKEESITSLAVCLMNAYLYPQHEQAVANLAQEIGFDEISVSHQVTPTIKIVPRGETTVLDAYLNPILRNYLSTVQRRFTPDSRLRLMTSTGGLVARSKFSGKDSVLSGPAGGVVGFAKVSEQLGFTNAIGFDMGGTSTDVARFDGQFERRFESTKAGVRIVHPMLAIETVAAGGGSICALNAGRLIVGPESAGSEPGPACYGAGGPLTITDVNLFLGRIDKDLFPFPLSKEAVDRRINEILSKLKNEHSIDFTPVQLALGYFEIAVHHMAQAIHKISIARGYDPRDYLLVGFGGAAPQMVCAVAQELGIRQILNHPKGSILSAVGNSLADISNHQTRAFEAVLEKKAGFFGWERDFQQLTTAATNNLIEQGIKKSEIEIQRSVDLRYSGTDNFLTIAEPNNQDYQSAFESLHDQRFGFRQSRPIEIVSLRVQALNRGNRLPPIPLPEAKIAAKSTSTVEAIVGQQSQAIDQFHRRQLKPNEFVAGPALVIDSNTSTFVDSGWTATVCADLQLLITKNQDCKDSTPRLESTLDRPDPVLLEVFNSSFGVIAEQMGITLQQTAISVNVKERLDFSCAVFDADGGLVVNAPHIPVHLGAMSETVKAVIDHFKKFQAGDVIVTNDPYQGGSHLPDVTVVTPIFIGDRTDHDFFVASRCHHAEIGGITPGSMPPNATCLGEEGVLISNFKAVEAGVDHLDLLRRLLVNATYPSRTPNDNISDIRAQIAANQHGFQQLQLLVQRFGRETVLRYMSFCQSAAEIRVIEVLSGFEKRVLNFTDRLDCGATIQVKIQMKPKKLIVDFTGTDRVLQNNLNANRGIVSAAVIYCMRLLINQPIPLNSGIMRPVEIILPTCFLNPRPADDPFNSPPCVGGNVETSQRIVDVLLGAFGIAAASQGTMNNLLIGDESYGYYETICGGSGATMNAKGADAVHTHMTNTRATDPEILESRFPMRLIRFEVRRGSGGKGRHNGGDGIVREIEFLRNAQVSILSNRRGENRPYGLEGGEDALPGRNLHIHGELVSELGNHVEIAVKKGERIQIETPGGGGFGAP